VRQFYPSGTETGKQYSIRLRQYLPSGTITGNSIGLRQLSPLQRNSNGKQYKVIRLRQFSLQEQ
jgi:hypothetical protein